MFGLFKKKWSEQQIKVLTNEIDQIFISLFRDEGRSNVPTKFLGEPYVQGFLMGYAATVMDVRFEARTWSKDERGAFQLALYRNINGADNYVLERILLDLDYARSLLIDQNFVTGKDQGGVCAILVHNKLKAGYTEPLIEEAKTLSNKMNIELGVAILTVTIFAFKIRWTKQLKEKS